MNKKVIIAIIAIVVIIGLAVFTGIKLGKSNTELVNGEPINNSTIPTQTNEPEDLVTASPEIKEEPTELPEPTPNVDTSKMTSEEKKKYAKELAKETWEKINMERQVYYSFENITSDEKYIIAVRDEKTTETLIWYEIDINTKTCKTI